RHVDTRGPWLPGRRTDGRGGGAAAPHRDRPRLVPHRAPGAAVVPRRPAALRDRARGGRGRARHLARPGSRRAHHGARARGPQPPRPRPPAPRPRPGPPRIRRRPPPARRPRHHGRAPSRPIPRPHPGGPRMLTRAQLDPVVTAALAEAAPSGDLTAEALPPARPPAPPPR